jgi:pimeloyl-ACP methyl ester carboxylesterase
VLVGHSYGGMVITGAAQALPGRIRRLVYSDAYVPGDGDSCWDLTSDGFRELFAAGAGADGFSARPPAGMDPRATAHPLASFMQKIRLTGAAKDVERRDYIYLSGWDGSPFGGSGTSARNSARRSPGPSAAVQHYAEALGLKLSECGGPGNLGRHPAWMISLSHRGRGWVCSLQ